jgi:predicted transcriptional regulator of viral defense system
MDTKNIRLGSNELKLAFTLEKNAKIAFTFKEAKEILETSNKAVYAVLARLRQKRRIRQIRAGLYLLCPARSGVEGFWTEHIFTILPILLKTNYYVGFWSALTYWGMTEQVAQTVHVVVTNRRRNLTFDDQTIQFVTYPESKFFGYVEERLGENSFNISNVEKTIVDSLTHLEYAGGISEVTKAIWTGRNKIVFDQLVDCAKRMRIRAVCLRLGYLLELLGLDESHKILSPEKPTGAPWLDPSTSKKQIGYSSRWGIRLNVPEEVILHWK